MHGGIGAAREDSPVSDTDTCTPALKRATALQLDHYVIPLGAHCIAAARAWVMALQHMCKLTFLLGGCQKIVPQIRGLFRN